MDLVKKAKGIVESLRWGPSSLDEFLNGTIGSGLIVPYTRRTGSENTIFMEYGVQITAHRLSRSGKPSRQITYRKPLGFSDYTDIGKNMESEMDQAAIAMQEEVKKRSGRGFLMAYSQNLFNMAGHKD